MSNEIVIMVGGEAGQGVQSVGAILAGEALGGPLRVASIGVLTEHFVVPVLIDIKRAHPELVPQHENLRTVEANAKLARGELDVAFYYEDVVADDVIVERLGHTPMSIYCGRGHPLFTRPRVVRADLLAHPFSVPMIGDTEALLVYQRTRKTLADELGVDPGIQKDGVAAHLQELLAANCHAIAPGLGLVRREHPTDIGPVDLLCRDGDGGAVAIGAAGHPAVTTVIPGMRKLTHVEQNIGVSAQPPLPQPLLAELKSHRWNRTVDWE